MLVGRRATAYANKYDQETKTYIWVEQCTGTIVHVCTLTCSSESYIAVLIEPDDGGKLYEAASNAVKLHK
jgi:hypothetical protein